MPLQFDSMLDFSGGYGFIEGLVKNAITTAVSITVVFLLVIALFYPLEHNRAKNYFKLFIYMGLINAFALTVHDSVIRREIEQSYKPEEPVSVPEKVVIEPRIGGDIEIPELKESQELDEIINNIENETIFEDSNDE